MMKRVSASFLFPLFAAVLFLVIGCNKVKVTDKDYVPVESVSLDQEELSLVIGDEYQLHETVLPAKASNKSVTWSSSNSSVASVSEGKIKAVTVGSATITVTTESGGHTARCNVQVVKETVHVTGVSLTPESMTLSVSGTRRLSVQLQPSGATNHKVSWSTSDESVAIVRDGLVTGVKQGTAVITVKTEDGGHEATASVRVVQPFTKITILSPDTSDSHYDADTKKYTFFKGDKFQLVAQGEPEGADDDLEFAVSGWSTDNYKKYYDITPAGEVSCVGVYASNKVVARSKANPSVQAEFVFDIKPQSTDVILRTIPSECGIPMNSIARNTKYIGVGATQRFRVVVEPSNTFQDVTIYEQLPGQGNVRFSLDGDVLTATVPAGTAASKGTALKLSKVKLKTRDGRLHSFDFINCLYDPYQPKFGDGISTDGKIIDSGFRGGDIFESSVNLDNNKVSCIIAYFGEEHMKKENDPFWELYFKPTTGILSMGKAIHGIAIPVNVSKLYRTSEPDGEYYYTDSGIDNLITDSGNLPSWIKNNDDWKSRLRFPGKHSALLNTCCHVYCNAGRGGSWEILPYLFFVEDALKKPSANESNKMEADSYAQFHTSFDQISNGLNARSIDKGALTGKYMTPWVLPTVRDFISIFTGENPENPSSNHDNPAVVERCKVYATSARTLGGVELSYLDTYWWLANENYTDRFCQGNISKNGNECSVFSNVKHQERKGYVLPIRYF